MEILTDVIVFVFGVIIGSFLNVVILRFQSGKGLGGRSMCMSCGETLRSSELIPIFSFMVQKGKCGHCNSKISWQYPAVEALSGLVFLLLFLRHVPYSEMVYSMWVFSVLIVIGVYDLRHKIIPDRLVYPLILVSLFSVFFNFYTNSFHSPDIYTLLAGPILALPIALVWFISKGKWVGLGDAKLLLAVGFFLGLSKGVAAFLLSFWIGAIFSIILLLVSKLYKKISKSTVTMRTEIPFAPFLILGTALAYFCQIGFVTLASWFTF